MISVALLIVALVLFILAAVGVPAGKYNLTALGLAFWAASLLVGPLFK